MTTQTLILTGDINLVNVGLNDRPFVNVREKLLAADLVFSNLECSIYKPTQGQSLEQEGFFADPEVAGRVLLDAGIGAVGIANNVNYGDAPIRASVAHLDAFKIPHTGAGVGREAARAPIIVERDGVRYGFVQHCSVYWGTDHEAQGNAAGIAVNMAHTAYEVPMYRDRRGWIPFNRPGIPPNIVTWFDPNYRKAYAEEVALLRSQVDVLVASCHWGLGSEVLDYMVDIAQTAIDAGADLVMGHGPHNPLPVSYYKGKPIFYGLGSFCFHTGHEGIKHGDWVGLVVNAQIEDGRLASTSFSLVRHSDANETVICNIADESKVVAMLSKASLPFGAMLEAGEKFIAMMPADDAGQDAAGTPGPAFLRQAPTGHAGARGHTPR